MAVDHQIALWVEKHKDEFRKVGRLKLPTKNVSPFAEGIRVLSRIPAYTIPEARPDGDISVGGADMQRDRAEGGFTEEIVVFLLRCGFYYDYQHYGDERFDGADTGRGDWVYHLGKSRILPVVPEVPEGEREIIAARSIDAPAETKPEDPRRVLPDYAPQQILEEARAELAQAQTKFGAMKALMGFTGNDFVSTRLEGVRKTLAKLGDRLV